MSYYLDEYFHPLYEDVTTLEIIKKNDSGYNKMSKYKFDNRQQKLIKVSVDAYTSPLTDGYIRDAITGRQYPVLIGSKESCHFFKVVMANGQCTSSNGSNVLYYTGPNEYAKHFNTNVDEKVVEKWKLKQSLC